MNYSLVKGAQKAIIQLIVFGFPIILQVVPNTWLNLSIGAVLSLAFNYVKVNWAISQAE